MAKISVVINTLNEELNLPFCLMSIDKSKKGKKFADEIVVVDMKSDDNTVKIAETWGAKVYKHTKTGYVEPARNFAVKKATGDWILILDADERLTPKLKQKLKELAENPEADYYAIARKNMIFGKWLQHSRWWPDYNIRFFKKDSVYWSDKIHGVPETYGSGADLNAEEDLAIIHEHYTSIEQFISRLNRYTTVQAKNKQDEGYIFAWQDILKKPAAEFFGRYFAGFGYKDGLHGLALSLLQAFSELVLYLKLWQLSGFEKKKIKPLQVVGLQKEIVKDLSYWQADMLVNEQGGLINRFRRKFRL